MISQAGASTNCRHRPEPVLVQLRYPNPGTPQRPGLRTPALLYGDPLTGVMPPTDSRQLLGGRFRLHELVGRGAAAAVYRGVDESLGREVALKVFTRDGGDPELLARQDAEIRILASLAHPGLVTLFDAGSDAVANRSYVVMEYVSGPDLRRQLREGALEPEDIARVGADLASALSYVHHRGVIHRDIKPGNILLYQPGNGAVGKCWRAKLADFGIARVMEENRLTGTGRTVGTAAYLSPEQALGGELTGASDVYSLGLVLLECLTGYVEFPGTPIESGVARLNRDPAIPTGISPDWAALLAAMTSRHPRDRPDAAQTTTSLRRLALAGGTPTAPQTPLLPPRPDRAPTGSPEPLPAPRTRRHRAIAAVCLAAVLVAGATAATPQGGSGTEQQTTSATPAMQPQNNPLDFHLDQLQSAIESSDKLLTILGHVRQAVTANDQQAALAYVEELEKTAVDEALRSGMTLEKYRAITEAIRLVRTDLQSLTPAAADSTAEALPEGSPDPAPLPAVEPLAPAPAAAPLTVPAAAELDSSGAAPQQRDRIPATPGRGVGENAAGNNGKSGSAPGHNKP